MLVDLRSDTVTRPTTAMRAAMAEAAVGDDVYGEDPTVNQLEAAVAARLGKEAALFVPSGTMANQLALWLHGRPGERILVSRGAHCLAYEGGAAAALSGLELVELGDPAGGISPEELDVALPPRNVHFAPVVAVALENTHNRAGGRIVPQDAVVALATRARARGLGLHLDGARLWNAHVASGLPLATLAAPFDTVSVCLSKGLGAPVGSLLAGRRVDVDRARHRRKLLGGGMRQAGILAAAGLHALEHHVARLAEDHASARRLADRLAGAPGIALAPHDVETNVVVWDLLPEIPLDAAGFVARARERGVLLSAMGPRRVRAVTHLDVDGPACEEAARIARALLEAIA